MGKGLAAAEYIKASGSRVEVSLMLNRHFPGEAEEITSAIDRIQPDCIALIMPVFTPYRNMMDFESHRASLEDAAALEGCFEKWGLNKDECLNNATQCTVSCAIKRLENGPDLPALFEQPQDELYLTLHPDCMLYVGNSGAETQCLGDLRSINIDETAQIIASLPGNRDYTAFYDVDDLPGKDALIGTLEKLSAAALYGDFESVIYRGLAEMGIPTRIIE